MDFKKAVIKTLTRDLESMGLSKEAARIKDRFNKKAESVAANEAATNIVALQSSLSDVVSKFEFYPVGSGQFPDKDEVALFYCNDDFSGINLIIDKCKKSGLNFQSVQTLDFFKMTNAGSNSNAIDDLEDPCYVITCTVGYNPEKI